MTNLAERLRQIERNPSPDLWDEIANRPVDPERRSSTSSTRRFAIIAASLVIGLAAVAFVAYAFRQPSPAPAPIDEPFAWPKNSCELVTVSEVEAATHSTVTQSGLIPDERLHAPEDMNPCQYETDDEHTTLNVFVRLDDVEGFNRVRDRDPRNVVMLSGLGDEAFSTGMASVWVRVGSGYFVLSSQHGAGQDGVAELQALARLALGSGDLQWQPSSDLSTTNPCQQDVASTWRAKMVPWLTSLLVDVGAPEGVPLTDADIIDTGSALQVLPDAYDDRLDVFVHAGVSDPDHDPTASTSLTFVGRGNGYRLYSSVNDSGSLAQFLAMGSDVWLTLYVYSANPGGSVELDPGGNREAWIKEMMDAIRVDPIPSC